MTGPSSLVRSKNVLYLCELVEEVDPRHFRKLYCRGEIVNPLDDVLQRQPFLCLERRDPCVGNRRSVQLLSS